MSKQYQIRVRGKQRDDMDIELFAQALLMIIEDLQAEQQQQDGQSGDDAAQEREA